MNDDSQLVETILIQDGSAMHLDYHNQRVNRARAEIFDLKSNIDLATYIDGSKAESECTKCRVIYQALIQEVQYIPYSLPTILSLKVVDVDPQMNYEHKWVDRAQLHRYYEKRGDADDIIMVRSGKLTDAYYANIALLQDGVWYTPKEPLLKGTARARLLENNRITERDILSQDISNYQSICLFNAMIPFGSIELLVDAIN